LQTFSTLDYCARREFLGSILGEGYWAGVSSLACVSPSFIVSGIIIVAKVFLEVPESRLRGMSSAI